MGIEATASPRDSNKGCTIEGEGSLVIGDGGVGATISSERLEGEGPLGKQDEEGITIVVAAET